MKLCIIGYGKMGKAIERLAPQYGFTEFVTIDNADDWKNKRRYLQECVVAIEFSTPQTVISNLLQCFDLQIPVVSGTTGWNENKDEFLTSIKRNKPISFIYGSNFSIGANIFFKLNVWLAQQMKYQSQYTISIEEKHHIHKKDAPSGTAITLEQSILSQHDNFDKIPIISHREAEVIGEHNVYYKCVEDTIHICHNAHSRDAFAHGALKAAAWLISHSGIYDFESVFEKV